MHPETPRVPPSPRVQLEVAFLDADEGAPAPAPLVAHDERPCLTVLVVAAEADFRRYVQECLREREDLRVVEAATVSAAVAVATSCPPDLLIVDRPESDVVVALSRPLAIVIVDEVAHGAPGPASRVRLLARPFTAEGLVAEVDRLLG